MIILRTPDPQKAQSLVKMAMISLRRLEQTDKLTYPSDTLVDYYSIIHKLMDAFCANMGFQINGENHHVQLIDMMHQKDIINEQTRRFLQEMRDYRNRIEYSGYELSKQYLVNHEKQILEIIKIIDNALRACK